MNISSYHDSIPELIGDKSGDFHRALQWLGGATIIVAILFAGCNNAPPQGTSKKVVGVTATTPVTGEVTDYQDFTGRLDALKTVDIRARVSGFIMTAPFKEGDMVHEGDLLFQIDRRTYQATLNQTEANLRQAIADRNLQERNTSRARRMIESRSIAQEDYDTTLATYEKSKATVGSMEAARDMARLYLDFTQVTAPLSGRISRRLVDPGNLIIADTTPLTTIVSDNPLYAYFDVDERTYLDLMDTASAGHVSWLTELQFPVMMRLANEEQFSRSGKVNFVDNRVNATTGTIRMRGVFDNPTGVLKSGLFVRIRLPIGRPYQAIMIPGAALARDQGRWYAYVVSDKHEVERRDVELGQEIQGLQVIKKGLSRTERVIISGMQRVKPGAPVEETMQPPPKAPASPLARLVNALPPVVAAKQSDKETRRQGDKEPGKADREAKKEVSGGS